jgi:acid phosphatase
LIARATGPKTIDRGPIAVGEQYPQWRDVSSYFHFMRVAKVLPHFSGIRPMRTRTTPLLSAVVLFLAGCAAPPHGPAGTSGNLARIEHIVVIFAENRSFDNLYGRYPGANGLDNASPSSWTQTDRNGAALATLPPVWKSRTAADPAYPNNLPNQPFRIDAPPINQPLSVPTRDLIHRFYTNQEQINHGKLDRYAAMSDAGGLVMGYYDGSSLPLWKLAGEYTLADNFFMAAFGGSFLNHFWLVCACTPVFPNAPAALVAALDASGKLALTPASPASALEGPPRYVNDGAITPDGFAVNTMQPPYEPSNIPPAAGADARFADPKQNPLPPQSMKTIGDTLSAKGLDWAWYAEAWNDALADGMQPAGVPRKVIDNDAPGAPDFKTHHQPFNYFSKYAPGTAERAKHLKDYRDLVTQIQTDTLPPVAFYKPEGAHNEHPGYADVLAGDIHIADLIGKIQASRGWKSTLIVVTYDENGGFWDHVPPPPGDRWGPGTRIPTLLIGAMVKKRFIDNTFYDTTSILKLITRRFALEPLPGVRANIGDLSNAIE